MKKHTALKQNTKNDTYIEKTLIRIPVVNHRTVRKVTAASVLIWSGFFVLVCLYVAQKWWNLAGLKNEPTAIPLL